MVQLETDVRGAGFYGGRDYLGSLSLLSALLRLSRYKAAINFASQTTDLGKLESDFKFRYGFVFKY